MQERISSREFAEWLAFNRLSPIGDERGDWQAASIAHAMSRVFGGKGRLEDFVLRFGPRKYPTAQEVEAKANVWLRIHQNWQKKHGNRRKAGR